MPCGTFTYGSFNTQLYSLDFESDLLGPHKQDAVLFNINGMTSDGYQTFNYRQRDAGYGKIPAPFFRQDQSEPLRRRGRYLE